SRPAPQSTLVAYTTLFRSTSLPLQGTNPQEMQMMMMMRRQPEPGQFVIDDWRQAYNIITAEPTATELPAGLDVLAVIHPDNLSRSEEHTAELPSPSDLLCR